MRNLPPATHHSHLEMVTVKEDGTKQISGDAGLKETQTYPELFGHAVALVYQRHRQDLV